MRKYYQKTLQYLIEWLSYERPNTDLPLCDYERIRYELRPGDVILVEGRSRISEVIKQVTQSPWSHSALYIGRLHDIDNIEAQQALQGFLAVAPHTQLVIESYLGKGTIVAPLDQYRQEHLRICRPQGLSREDAQKVIAYAIDKLGSLYDIRQIFDLWRFLVPWSILPRRWRSSLFIHHIGNSTKVVCSTLIAQAYTSIDFPILPIIKQHEKNGIELFMRNPRIFTPRDFDYSPYFAIIKYPFVSYAEGPYRSLPWNKQRMTHIDVLEATPASPVVSKNRVSFHAWLKRTKNRLNRKKPLPEK